MIVKDIFGREIEVPDGTKFKWKCDTCNFEDSSGWNEQQEPFRCQKGKPQCEGKVHHIPDWEDVVVKEAVKIINTKEEAARRKGQPVATGVLAYFPDALLAVAEVSRVGNDQHNPGQPLHWAKDKSTDEPDALARHLIDHLRGGGEKFDSDGVRHAAKIAWRALALLQREIDAEKK